MHIIQNNIHNNILVSLYCCIFEIVGQKRPCNQMWAHFESGSEFCALSATGYSRCTLLNK